MIKEGAGQVAPSPIQIAIPMEERKILRTMAIERSAKYAERRDKWGEGITKGTLSGQQADFIGGPIPLAARPILCGFAGEWATAKHINNCLGTNLGIDCVYRRFGDNDCDIELHGLRIQVKARWYENAPCLVRVKCLGAHVYVFSQWNFSEDAILFGCISVADLKKCKQEKGRGQWMNYHPEHNDLDPMSRLIDDIKWRRAEWL